MASLWSTIAFWLSESAVPGMRVCPARKVFTAPVEARSELEWGADDKVVGGQCVAGMPACSACFAIVSAFRVQAHGNSTQWVLLVT